MIPEAIFFAVVTCAPTQVVNQVDGTTTLKTKKDTQFIVQAKKRCGEIYKESPCVKYFLIKKDKWGDRMYSITCGPKDYKKPSIWQSKESK